MLIDAFMLFNELDLLEIRLHELADVVDKFVIVESQEMHGSAGLKRFNLEDNWDIVKPFQSKIHYEKLQWLEPAFSGRESCWPRENFNRNALMRPILELSKSPDDIVMISDCDEIPSASMLRLNAGKIEKMSGTRQDFYYYNLGVFGGTWHGTVIGPVSELQKEGGPQAVRNQRDNYPALRDGGWHFSYFGGLDMIREKTKNFAHSADFICQELNSRPDEEVLKDIADGRDLYRRDGVNFVKQTPDESRLPEYLVRNKERFRKFWP